MTPDINLVTFTVTGLCEDRAKRIQAHFVLLHFADFSIFKEELKVCVNRTLSKPTGTSICLLPFSVLTKVRILKAMVFLVVIYGCES